jgi:hypothetical protein
MSNLMDDYIIILNSKNDAATIDTPHANPANFKCVIPDCLEKPLLPSAVGSIADRSNILEVFDMYISGLGNLYNEDIMVNLYEVNPTHATAAALTMPQPQPVKQRFTLSKGFYTIEGLVNAINVKMIKYFKLEWMYIGKDLPKKLHIVCTMPKVQLEAYPYTQVTLSQVLAAKLGFATFRSHINSTHHFSFFLAAKIYYMLTASVPTNAKRTAAAMEDETADTPTEAVGLVTHPRPVDQPLDQQQLKPVLEDRKTYYCCYRGPYPPDINCNLKVVSLHLSGTFVRVFPKTRQGVQQHDIRNDLPLLTRFKLCDPEFYPNQLVRFEPLGPRKSLVDINQNSVQLTVLDACGVVVPVDPYGEVNVTAYLSH